VNNSKCLNTKGRKLEKVAVVQFIKGENKKIFEYVNLVKI
jgi:hypothetical protein